MRTEKRKKTRFLTAASVAVILLSGSSWVSARRTININDENAVVTKSKVTKGQVINRDLGKSKQSRTFNCNPQLKTLTGENVGDVLLLDFFDDRKYQATIKRVSADVNGITGIVATVNGANFGYCYISVSDRGTLINTELPESDERYIATDRAGWGNLSEYKISEMEKNELECHSVLPPETEAPDIPDLRFEEINIGDLQMDCINQVSDENAPAVVKVLVVYTRKARIYAERSSTIETHINAAFLKANEVSENSRLGINFELAHSYETDYEEVNSSQDLHNLTYRNDGKLDEVHTLRRLYNADLVMLVPEINFAGGLAYRMTSTFGDPAYGFALSRVQQLSWSYTLVHEIGHNMGCGHHKDQSSDRGPGLYSYSAGWKGVINGENKCTVMSYEKGYTNDLSTYSRIPYFSNPDMTYPGTNVSIGDPEDSNNALTFRKSKHVTAFYSDIINNAVLTDLKLNGTTIPGFDADIHYYSIDVTSATATVRGIANACTKVSGDVTDTPLNYGDNTFTISAFSNGYFTNYTVTLHRVDPSTVTVDLLNTPVGININYVVSADGTPISNAGRNYVKSFSDFLFNASFTDTPLKVFATASSRNPEELTPQKMDDGTYLYAIRQITESLSVTFGPGLASWITGTEYLPGINVRTYGNTLYITAEKTSKVQIYTLSGMLYKQFTVTPGTFREPLSRGVYIVEIGGERFKVIIRH